MGGIGGEDEVLSRCEPGDEQLSMSSVGWEEDAFVDEYHGINDLLMPFPMRPRSCRTPCKLSPLQVPLVTFPHQSNTRAN